MVCLSFWPIPLPHTAVFPFRCKDNIARDCSRYCDPCMGRREYSSTGDLLCGLPDSSGEESLRSCGCLGGPRALHWGNPLP